MKIAILVVLAACSSGDPTATTAPMAPPQKPTGPIPIAFGDCAGPTSTWISGPRPQAFTSVPEIAPTPEPQATAEPVVEPDMGFGTIGTGRYGTIGHGAGIGNGYATGGGGRRRGASVPSLRVGTATTTGDLDKAIIRRYIKQNLNKLQYCYEKALLANDTLAGTVTAEFTIGANGTVPSSKATGVSPDVSACVAGVVKGIEFPRPKSGVVTVSYPLEYQRSSTSSRREVLPAVPSLADRDKPDYVPGAENPLSGQTAALMECVRENSKPYGGVVVQFGNGTQVFGLDDPKAIACVTALAKAISTQNVQRCSFAFGEVPAIPATTVGATSIAIDGKTATTAAEVYAILDQPHPSDAVVAMRLPHVLQPAPNASMDFVFEAMDGIRIVGDDFVFGAAPSKMPVVPVPRGTGTTWVSSDPATLEIRVGTDNIDAAVTEAAAREPTGIISIEAPLGATYAEVAPIIEAVGKTKMRWRVHAP